MSDPVIDKLHKELGQVFENRFDCWAEEGDEPSTTLAMTKERFVEVVHEVLMPTNRSNTPELNRIINLLLDHNYRKVKKNGAIDDTHKENGD